MVTVGVKGLFKYLILATRTESTGWRLIRRSCKRGHNYSCAHLFRYVGRSKWLSRRHDTMPRDRSKLACSETLTGT